MFGVQPFLAENIKQPTVVQAFIAWHNAMYTKANHHFQQLFDQKSDRI